MPMEIGHLSVILYSESQDCFHVEDLHDCILSNLKRVIFNKDLSDHHLVGIADSGSEINVMIELIRELHATPDRRKEG